MPRDSRFRDRRAERQELCARANRSNGGPMTAIGRAEKPERFSRTVELLFYAASPLSTLITSPILARSLGPADRGEYAVAMAVVGLCLVVSAWGQAEVYMAEARAGRVGIGLQTRIAAVGGIVCTLVAIGLLLALKVGLIPILATALWIPLLNQTNIWRSVLIAGQSLKAPAVGGALFSGLRTVLFLVTAPFGFLTLVSSLVITQGAAYFGSLVALRKPAMRLSRRSTQPPARISPLMRAGGGIIAFDLLNAVSLRSDVVLLQLLATPEIVGIYAAPVALTTASLAFTAGLKARAQAGAVSGMSRRHLGGDAARAAGLALVGSILIVVLAPFVVPLLLGPEYTQSVIVLQALAPATFFLIMFDFAQGILVVIGKRVALLQVAAIAAVANLVALWVLIPPFGALGAAVGSGIGYLVSASAAWIVIGRSYREGGEVLTSGESDPADRTA